MKPAHSSGSIAGIAVQRPGSARVNQTQSGMTLIEFMVGLTIGLLLVMALASLFSASSFNFSEEERTARQIENGRYATDILNEDIRHAGFYGESSNLGAVPGTPPDPCSTTVATIATALSLPVYGIDAPDAAPSCLPDYVAGTDVLVIRRSSTTDIDATTADPSGYYTQVSLCSTETTAVTLAQAVFPLHQKDCGAQARVRQFHTHIYFISPCVKGTGAGGACAAGDKAVPTLKRLELGPTGLTLTPLVEGIENLQFEYGQDTDADGSPNSFSAKPAFTGAAWSKVVAIKVYLLARNSDPTPGYADTKTYTLGTKSDGTANTTSPGGAYKRHVYSTTARVVNVSQRAEPSI
jgi:type IV pilus assembly protein PilW